LAERSGDPDGIHLLETWMELYGSDVMSTAYAYVRNYHQAQDIAQDVFLRAYTKRDTYRGDGSVRTWLLSITVNRCKDYLRSWAARHEIRDESILDREVADGDTESQVVRKLEQDELWQAVLQLPDKYRSVISLYYIQGLSGQEVAQVLQTSEQNVRTRLHRARSLLRQILEQKGDVHHVR
jgi:RNA polymerase sigma-70 factor, ECF subfamily